MTSLFAKDSIVRLHKNQNPIVLKTTISRATKTMAILSNGTRYDIISGHSKGDSFGGSYLTHWTEEDQKLLEAQKIRNNKKQAVKNISNIDVNLLDTEDIAMLNKINLKHST